MGPKGVVGLAGALIVVLLVLSSVYIIPETHRGVMLRFGELVETDIQAGIHFKVPVIDQVREFDIRVLTMDLPSRQYLTIEKKPLDVDSYIAWKILNVDQFYRATGGDEYRAQSLLLSRVDNGLQDEFGIRTMHEVVSGQRDELMHTLRDRVNETSVNEFGIEVLDVRVKAIEFPGQVSENVYRRMATERGWLRNSALAAVSWLKVFVPMLIVSARLLWPKLLLNLKKPEVRVTVRRRRSTPMPMVRMPSSTASTVVSRRTRTPSRVRMTSWSLIPTVTS